MESIRKIRQAYHRDKKPIRQIAREFHVSKNTVKKIIRSDVTEQVYRRTEQPRPKLSQHEDHLKELLAEDRPKPIRHRRSAQLLFEQLQREGYSGGYDSVRRYKSQSSDSSTGLFRSPLRPEKHSSSTGVTNRSSLAASTSRSRLPSSGSATAVCRFA